MPGTPIRPGYDFVGWNTQQGGGAATVFTATTAITGPTTVYAQWTPTQGGTLVTVTFNANALAATLAPNGASREVRPGQNLTTNSFNVTMPAPPSRLGWDFVGWFDTAATTGGTQFTATTAITTNRTVYARWTYLPVVVTFNANMGVLAADGGSRTLGEGQSINTSDPVRTMPANPTRAHFRFVRWDTAADGSGTAFTAATAVPADITVFAYWAPVMHTVTFSRNNDTTGAAAVYTTRLAQQNSPLNGIAPNGAMPTTTPIWPARVFVGWNTAADRSGTTFTAATAMTTAFMGLPANNTADGNVTIYAQWDATVTFIQNHPGPSLDGTVVGTYTGRVGSNAVVPTNLNYPAPVGGSAYVFLGWSEDPDASGGNPVPVISHTTNLYAIWSLPINNIVIGNGDNNTPYFPQVPGTPQNPPEVLPDPDDDDRTVLVITPPQGDGNFHFNPEDVTPDMITPPGGYVVDDVQYDPDTGNLIVIIMIPRVIFTLNGGHISGNSANVVHEVQRGDLVGENRVPLPRNTNNALRGWRIDGVGPILMASQVALIEMLVPRVTLVAVWGPSDEAGGGGGAGGGGAAGGGAGAAAPVIIGGAIAAPDYGPDVIAGAMDTPTDHDHVNYNPPTGR